MNLPFFRPSSLLAVRGGANAPCSPLPPGAPGSGFRPGRRTCKSSWRLTGTTWQVRDISDVSIRCCNVLMFEKPQSFVSPTPLAVTDANGAKMPLRERISRSAKALLEVRAQNLPLQFYMSTLDGLGDLFEDEVIPTPIPMRVGDSDYHCSSLN